MSNLIPIKFIRNYGQTYKSGMTAGFLPDHAERLIKAGIATRVTAPAEAPAGKAKQVTPTITKRVTKEL